MLLTLSQGLVGFYKHHREFRERTEKKDPETGSVVQESKNP
jgi:hypothetical protein